MVTLQAQEVPEPNKGQGSDGSSLAGRLGASLDAALNWALDTQWQRAQHGVANKKRMAPTADGETIARAIVRDFIRDMTALGATSGGASAIPGPGTGVRLAAGVTVETAALLERSVYMTLAVAHAYGHDLSDVEVRRYAVIRVLAVWAGVTDGLLGFTTAVAQGLGTKIVKAIPKEAVFAVNRAVGRRVLVKWGTKSGAVRLGSVLPFGLGVAFGGAGNYAMAKGLGRAALAEFRTTATG